jgi:hypothetical protein
MPEARTGSLAWERQTGSGDDPVTVDIELGDAHTRSFVLDHDLRIPLRCPDAVTP